MSDEANKNKKFQDTLIEENKRLQAELDRVKSEKLELEKDVG